MAFGLQIQGFYNVKVNVFVPIEATHSDKWHHKLGPESDSVREVQDDVFVTELVNKVMERGSGV
jgi:hypothetical protein